MQKGEGYSQRITDNNEGIRYTHQTDLITNPSYLECKLCFLQQNPRNVVFNSTTYLHHSQGQTRTILQTHLELAFISKSNSKVQKKWL